MSSLARKKHEDLNLKKLRELVTLPHNKKCFDCTQRGPTYVNMTIGAFVCTSCSGFLRGLNPPHRIKSISMASFNDQEIQFLQNHGNQVCHNTWYALWNSAGSPEPESREEHKIKDFLSEKYEKKRWYSSKPKVTSTQQEPEAKPLKTLLGENAPKVVLSKQIKEEKPPMISSPVNNLPPIQRNQPASKSNMDLLGDLGNDPFGSSSQHTRDSGFAAFQQPPPPQQQQLQQPQQQPFFDAFSNSTSISRSNSFDLFANQTSNNSQQPNDFFSASSNQSSAFQQSQASNSSTDKYAALADLSSFKNDSTQSVFSGGSIFSEGPAQDYNNQSNGQPNPFMSPGTSSSGVAVFQQQQQKPQNPFQTNDTANIFGSDFRSSNAMPNWPSQQSNVNGNINVNDFMNSASQFSTNNISSNQNFNMFNTSSSQFQSQSLPSQNYQTNNFSNQPFPSQFNQDASRQQQAFSGNQFSNMNNNAQFNYQQNAFPAKQNNSTNSSNPVPNQSNNFQLPTQNNFNPPSNASNQFQKFNTQQNVGPFAQQPQNFSASFSNQQNSNVKNPPFGGVQLPGFGTQQSTQQSFGTWNQNHQQQQKSSVRSTNPFM